MIRKPITKQTELILQFLSVVMILAGYSFMSWRQHNINPTDKTIPNLYQFIDGVKTLSTPDPSKRIWLLDDFYYSGERLLLGVFCGVSMAFLIGLGMGVYPKVEAFFRWPITVLGSIPPTAMLAIYFVVFGIGLEMYVAMIAFGIFPALALSIYRAAITDVTDHAVYKAYTLGADSLEVVVEVVVRQILPRIIEFVRIAIGPALIFLIAAEWSNADVGFGYRLKMQSRMTNMNVVYIYLIVLSIVSFFIDCFLLFVRNKFCSWFTKQ